MPPLDYFLDTRLVGGGGPILSSLVLLFIGYFCCLPDLLASLGGLSEEKRKHQVDLEKSLGVLMRLCLFTGFPPSLPSFQVLYSFSLKTAVSLPVDVWVFSLFN